MLAAGMAIASNLLSQREAPPDDAGEESMRFARVYGLLEQNYVDEIDPDRALLEGAIRGMLSTLDPFSSFFNRDQFQILQEQAQGKTMGFGSILYVTAGKVVILQTAERSPSWRAGLGPGDEIVELNGTRIDRLDFQSLVQLLERARSQPVTLGVIHPGKVVAQDFRLNPAEVNLPTVDRVVTLSSPPLNRGEPLSRRVGYIHLTGFESKTAQEVKDAIDHLGGANLKGLLLDLRDNPGGIVDAALETASLFLKPDLPALTVRGRAMPEKSYRTFRAPAGYDLPLILLVNENTASAAEIFAAALEEHDRALIAGEPTFGKGVVQSVMELGDKTGLALTTAQYFTPSGRSIQRPLPGTALEATASATGSQAGAGALHTDNARPLQAGGGVTPDVIVPAPALDPWVTFLNERGVLTNFASEFLTRHGRVDESFEPDSKVIGELKDFLTRGQIQVPQEYWAQDQDYLKLRIKTEVFNLAFGLASGNEVEVRNDPQVRKAILLFPKIVALLNPSKPGAARVKTGAKRPTNAAHKSPRTS